MYIDMKNGIHLPARRKLLKHLLVALGFGIMASYNKLNLKSLEEVKTDSLALGDFGLKGSEPGTLETKDWGPHLKIAGLVTFPKIFGQLDIQSLFGTTPFSEANGLGMNNSVELMSVPLHQLLSQVKPLKRARYVRLHCADALTSANKTNDLTIDIHRACDSSTRLSYTGQAQLINSSSPIHANTQANRSDAMNLILKYQENIVAQNIIGIELVENIT